MLVHDCGMGVGAALHVTNGDIVVELLSRAGLADRALAWPDVLHEGPVPEVPLDEFRRIRSEFLAGAWPEERPAVDQRLRACDEALVVNRDGDYVLWFEADLFCQLQLTQVLARLGELGVSPGRITLVSVGGAPRNRALRRAWGAHPGAARRPPGHRRQHALRRRAAAGGAGLDGAAVAGPSRARGRRRQPVR